MAREVVIIGGGISGLTVARNLKSQAGDLVNITVVTKDYHYIGGPTRPLLLTNEESYDRIIRGYDELGKEGINVVVGHAYSIDTANRRVYINETVMGNKTLIINYDYLVLATGVVYDGSSINGYDKYWFRNANVYDPGRVNVLKSRIWSAEGGNIIVYAPKAPYRCAPAPTETALLIHTVLRHRGIRDRFRIIHIDANESTQPPVIADVVKELYAKAGIELVTKQEIIEVTDREVITRSGEKYPYDILAMLEPNRAPSFIINAGLGNPWVEVRAPNNLRTAKFDDVFAVGDIAKLPYPKNQEIAFESALYAVNNILEDLGLDKRVSVQYGFLGWAYVGNVMGELSTLSVQFGFDYTQQPPKPMKDPEPRRDYTLQKDRWMQTYLTRLFGY
ncbi:NAD(P)/FAD-dependent oxidoreductase [Vulcanisaeta thermophila]|uniref:NAD(P)/FAD-dependent oxidoreductase n=1 Tax=Vulcanisaeta thermophila TaxID=867917 RepID=UPI000B1C55FD|nr:FAD/NAD(P)-binding oxidoreductase [Vulcanisaeta thermophila]